MKKSPTLMLCLLGASAVAFFSVALAGPPELLDRPNLPNPVAKLLASDGEYGDLFGSAIAVDGDTAVLASPWDTENGEFSGSAYVFTLTDDVWTEQAKLVPSDGAPYGLFGYSVALDGDTAIVGALGSADEWGSAYVFIRANGAWTEQAKLLPFDGAAIDYLGHSVAIDGDTAIVGAPDWNFYRDPGSVYVFTRTNGVWTQQAKLAVAGIRAGHKFGHEVTLDGDTVMVGAFGVGPDYWGAVHVFVRKNGVWRQEAKLRPANGPANDYFGFGLDLEGDTALIGAPRDAVNGDSAGAVYVFQRRDGAWEQRARLLPADGASPDWFGKTIAIEGDTAVIGAPYDDDNGWWSGSAYMFTRTEDDWTEAAKILPRDGLPEDGFGFALGLTGNTAVIGAPWEVVGPGSAYVFQLRIMRRNRPASSR